MPFEVEETCFHQMLQVFMRFGQKKLANLSRNSVFDTLTIKETCRVLFFFLLSKAHGDNYIISGSY